MFISSFWSSLNKSVADATLFKKVTNMSIPTSGAAEGTMSEITIVTRIGKIKAFHTLETGLS